MPELSVQADTALKRAERQEASIRLALPLAIGVSAALALLLFYIGLVGALQGFQHVRQLLWQDRYFLLPIAVGFAAQWGLFVQLWRVHRAHRMGMSTAVASSGTGTSMVSMVACCLHHVTDVLPLTGLSGAALFLGQFRTPFMALAVGMNLAGVAWMVYQLRRARQRHCHTPPARPATPEATCHSPEP